MAKRACEKETILDQLATMIDERMKGESAEDVLFFSQIYYLHIAEEDLVERALEDLYGAVLSHWNFARQRDKGKSKIRVYNPSLEDQGWQSCHSILEVVMEDRPFLVESIAMELNRQGLTNHLIIHPIFGVDRTAEGALKEIKATLNDRSEKGAEVFIHVEFDRLSDPARLEEISQNIAAVLGDVCAATEDWEACLEQVRLACTSLKNMPKVVNKQAAKEAVEFLDWAADDHFVFLGYREYQITNRDEVMGFCITPETGLGVLRDEIAALPKCGFLPLSDEACSQVCSKQPIIISKATSRSTVHRPGFMDYIGIKQFDKNGNVVGEKRFLGLYSSSAYQSNPSRIPLINNKIAHVIKQSGFTANTHNGKALLHILETLPRDELFHAKENELLNCSLGILQLAVSQRVRLFIRDDVYGHFFSVLVFVPRDRYTTNTRHKLQKIFLEVLQGDALDFKVQLSESILARIHFVIHRPDGRGIEYDLREIEQQIVDALHSWEDGLLDALHGYFGEEQGNHLHNHYGKGFSAAYRDDFSPRNAILDLERIEAMAGESGGIRMMLYQPLEMEGNSLRFKLYCQDEPAPLSHTLPMLENMGVRVIDERPYEIIEQSSGASFWIHDFGLQQATGNEIDIERLKPLFQKVFEQVWSGRIENDGFNSLVIRAGMDWQEVTILRAFYFYLRQTGVAFSQGYVEQTLANNPETSRLLINFFITRFDPEEKAREKKLEKIKSGIENAIDQVASLDEDRILRRYLELIQAIVRTNYFCFCEDRKGFPYLSVKFDPLKILALPEPRPKHEIFVYSPRVEGVHLRGGNVARGGLRWSDRREDFRTEVLGLMKAQISKNAVIVPTGAKGGFVAKQLVDSMDREAVQSEVIDCYSTFIQGLLDVTDNLSGEEVVKPEKVLCYDEDDPYLVVAADKGTATFSDIANGIAIKHGFWLGDAFASGGSVGYDHKQMGITAKGAWESVKRHFRELGSDIQQEPFTVVGVGDMSGDVFGNGMLLSEQIKLVAAFNHLHIFLDPDPDPAVSFKERKRLFGLPRSSWEDYKKTVISRGGGIYLRRAKSIPLSAEVRAILGVDEKKMTPNRLIQAMLKAPVDLLWNGGIGTYVKSVQEHDGDVGDRANDAVRVNGSELNCKVVGEGGNLGFTQRGRIEFASKGGRVNTDSVDNSAGVDCSDHEVNIKILLNKIVSQGDLTAKQRNNLLDKMTGEVAELVLRHNYLQNGAISMIEAHAPEMLASHSRLIEVLEEEGLLNRGIEFLPNQDELEERKANKKGLLRPEISVLVAYSKMALKDRLLESEYLETQYLLSELDGYFPVVLKKKFGKVFGEHRLKHEIIANQLVNNLVNRLGISFPFRMMDETGADIVAVVRNYRLACQLFSALEIWDEIEALDGLTSQPIQLDMGMEVRKLVERSMFWLQRNRYKAFLAEDVIKEFVPAIAQLSPTIIDLIHERELATVQEKVNQYRQDNVPEILAKRVAVLTSQFACLDIIAIKESSAQTLEEIAAVYFELGKQLRLGWLNANISKLPRSNFWQSLARSAVRDDFHAKGRALTIDILRNGVDVNSAEELVGAWCQQNSLAVERYQKLIQRIEAGSGIELEKVAVVLKELHEIVLNEDE
ncbi:MAG: NAD-glutamate dehydrogenase [Candidatus Reddybacter sp.]